MVNVMGETRFAFIIAPLVAASLLAVDGFCFGYEARPSASFLGNGILAGSNSATTTSTGASSTVGASETTILRETCQYRLTIPEQAPTAHILAGNIMSIKTAV